MSDASAATDRAASELKTPEGRDEATKKVGAAASQAADTVASKAKQAQGEAQAAAGDLADKAQSTAEDVRRRVGEASSAARDWAVDQSDVLRDTVQTKPLISIGVSAASAFAAGLVLGILLARD